MSTTPTTSTTTATTTNSNAGTQGVEPHDGPVVYGYAQWVTIRITNIGNIPIKLVNLSVSWGKLYINGNKDDEVPASRYNNQVIESKGGTLVFSSCGRSDSPSGTEGNFDLVDPSASDKQIRHFYWSCPWGAQGNQWTVSGSNSKFMVEDHGANPGSTGALGTITVEVLNK